MPRQDILPRLPIKGSVNGPISGWIQTDYANYTVVLNDDGVIDPIFTSDLATSTSYEVADEAARLALAGTAKKGDIAKQADTEISYSLKNSDGSSNSDWMPLDVESVYKGPGGQLYVTATGIDQNVTIVPSGNGYVEIANYLYVDGGIEGDGDAIYNLNASRIASGTLNDGRLSANIARRNTTNTFTSAAIFNSSVSIGDGLTVTGAITGDGSGVTNLNTANISTGTLAVNRGGTGIASYTTGNFIRATGSTTLSEVTPATVRSAIGADNASNLISGTIAYGLLPTGTTATQGALLLASSGESIAGTNTTKASTPAGVKDYVNAQTTTIASADKIVKTNGAGLIDSSFISISSVIAWDDLEGTTTDTGGTQGDVLSSLVLYNTPTERGIAIDTTTDSVNWFTDIGTVGKLYVPTLTGADKTWTLPNKTGTVLLSTDAATTATADAIVQASGSGTINANFIPTLTNITYTGQLRTPALTSGAVGGSSTSKLAIYDSSGTLRGYIPVYPS